MSARYGVEFIIKFCYAFLLFGFLQVRSDGGIDIGINYTSTPEERLFTDLLEKRAYKEKVIPRYDTSQPITLEMSFTILQIKSMDERQQEMSIHGWFDVLWKDPRLSWTPSDYNNLSQIIVPASDVWTPDITVENSAQDSKLSEWLSNFHIKVRSNGQLVWQPGGEFGIQCDIDITYFPFDEQLCEVIIMAWSSSTHNVIIKPIHDRLLKNKYREHGEWHIDDTFVESNVEKSLVQDETSLFSIIRFKIHMVRKPLYFGLNVILPCILLSLLTLGVFCLPPDAGEKVGLGLTVLLSFSVFLLIVEDSIPRTSEVIPLISVYLTGIMGMTAISVFLTIWVLAMHHHSAKPVPRWTRKIVFGILAKLVNFKHANSLANLKPDPAKVHPSRSDIQENYRVDVSPVDSIVIEKREAQREEGENGWEIRKIAALLEEIVEKQRADEVTSGYKEEWIEVARVIDRFCFVIATAVVFVLSISLLIIMPNTKAMKSLEEHLP